MLGHCVSTDGLSVLEDRAAAIRELATPRSLKELWHIMGIFGYYRQFIPRYAMVAAPLTRLTKVTRFRKLPDGTWQPQEASVSSSVVGWGPAHDAALQSLKDALSNPPTLAFPDFTAPFIVYVDASHDGMAACLHQPFIPKPQLPFMSCNPTLPFATANPSFSFDFADDELNRLRTGLQSDRVFCHTYQLVMAGEPPLSDRFKMVNGIWYWRLRDGRLATGLPEALIPTVLAAAHESFGHWGFEKTWAFVKAPFYRPGLSDTVREYVRRCPDCKRVKPSHQHRLSQMSPHEVPGTAFHTVSMDIVLGLPPCGSFDAGMVIVDIFSKLVILRPMSSRSNARECGTVFFDTSVCRGLLPVKLITDRDPRFVSQLWDELTSQLRIECELISAYHQQADPAERYIQTFQTLLRLYVVGDNWVDCLSFIELVLNNTVNSSTGFSPNQLLFIDPPNPLLVLNTPPTEDADPADRLAAASARVEAAHDNLDRAFLAQKKYYDYRHNPRALKASDGVFFLLDDHSVRSLVQGMHKLRDTKWGLFTIVEMVGTQAAQLDLPVTSRVHPVISILHLQPCIEDTFGRTCKPPPAAIIDGDAAWEVERIVGERKRGRRTEFKVKWKGYPDTEFEWEPEENLRQDLGPTATRLINDYGDSQRTAVHATLALTAGGHADHKHRPVYFISRVLKSYEENYTILELEMAAILWAILKFQRYLDGSIFTVVTNHQSLLSITGSSSTTLYSARIDKWRMLLAPYLGQITLVHRAGKIHGNADGLSRSRQITSGSESPGGHTQVLRS